MLNNKGYFKSTGKDGLDYELEYVIENQPDAIDQINRLCFKTVFACSSETDWFDFKVTFIGISEVKVTDMFLPQNPLYRGKGVPEALILETANLFPDRAVISSSNKFPVFKRESRWPAGTKVWERLVDRRLAFYDADKDVFRVISLSQYDRVKKK